MSIQEIADTLAPKVAEGNFDSVIKFDCGEDGVMVIDNQSISTEDGDADCTVGVSLEDLHATIYTAMGISPQTQFEIERRPFYVTKDGTGRAVQDVFA